MKHCVGPGVVREIDYADICTDLGSRGYRMTSVDEDPKRLVEVYTRLLEERHKIMLAPTADYPDFLRHGKSNLGSIPFFGRCLTKFLGLPTEPMNLGGKSIR